MSSGIGSSAAGAAAAVASVGAAASAPSVAVAAASAGAAPSVHEPVEFRLSQVWEPLEDGEGETVQSVVAVAGSSAPRLLQILPCRFPAHF